jgi:hypothetical protein
MTPFISPLLAITVNRIHIPIIWAVGGVLVVLGVFSLFGRHLLGGAALIILGLILGALNLLVFIP